MIERFPTICVCLCVYCYGTHSHKLCQLQNCQNGPYNPHFAEAGTPSQVVLVGVLLEFRVRAPEVVTAAAPSRFGCESNEKEQRPARHVHKNGAAVLCRNPNHSPTEWHPHCCIAITIIICGSTPFIVLFFLILHLLILPLPFLDDNDCIHPLDSEPYNNSNGDSMVDKLPSRSKKNKPIDTPSKQERKAFTSTTCVHVHCPR